MSGFKLYQHVYIAVGTEVISQGGSEKGQSSNVVSTTEASYLPFGDLDVLPIHIHSFIKKPTGSGKINLNIAFCGWLVFRWMGGK